MTDPALEEVKRRLREDTPFWAENVGKIIDKRGRLVPFEMNAGQLALNEALLKQRAEGGLMRALILKARQIGFSTFSQAVLIQRATQIANYHTAVVAHDRETGAKLYRMGETFYRNLPDELGLKPAIASHRRARMLHFSDGAKEAWMHGDVWPDSTYLVDTAGEFQAGRGATYRGLHLSEVAFWENISAKLTALRNAVPDEPDTIILEESTANGFNGFKDEWDRAEAGESGYLAFFWAWWQEPTYKLEFMNEAEAEAFVIGDGPYGEEEPKLVEMFGLSKEQLNWRRNTIANKCLGRIEIFHQEYPSTPHEAFISTGQRVFDPYTVGGILLRTDTTDPREPSQETPGPLQGTLRAGATKKIIGRSREELDVATEALWVPGRQLGGEKPEWKFWLERDEEGMPVVPSEMRCIIGVDVSGGQMEERDEPDYHAIEVIDHATKEQLAEYRSRIDPDLLAEKVLLAALYFNDAFVAIERTGSWGLPVLRRLYMDFRWMRTYRSSSKDRPTDKVEKRLGWDTNSRTKPIMVAGAAQLMREGVDGIRSRLLASEVNTYVRNDRGKMDAEPGKFDDALIAWMIAQQVAAETPLRLRDPDRAKRHTGYRPRDPVTGY